MRLPAHLLIPGLVNLHCHAAMSLLRGLADDLPLMTWLQEHIWPAEARHVSDEFVHDGSLLAAAEMLRGGITCFNDMYFFPEATARAALRAGIRASLGVITVEFPSAYATDAASYLHKGLATRDAYQGEELLSFCLAPHAPYTVSDDTLRRIATIAEEIDAPIHTHLHETTDEIAQGLARNGVRPLERLRRLGIVGPRLIAVHAIHLDEAEIDLLAREGASIAHCPSSNLKLANGIAPAATFRAKGITMGLGTDGAASNNRLDLLGEMRTASLLAKGASGNARALRRARGPAHRHAGRRARPRPGAGDRLDRARQAGGSRRGGTFVPGNAPLFRSRVGPALLRRARTRDPRLGGGRCLPRRPATHPPGCGRHPGKGRLVATEDTERRMTTETQQRAAGNFDAGELAKFGALAHQWWDPESDMFGPLHRMNPLRLAHIDRLVGGLAGKRAIDVGCGGGILAESMAVKGARVTGIDLGEKALKVAMLHRLESGVEVDYRHVSAEDAAQAEPGDLRRGDVHGDARARARPRQHGARLRQRSRSPAGGSSSPRSTAMRSPSSSRSSAPSTCCASSRGERTSTPGSSRHRNLPPTAAAPGSRWPISPA